MNWIYIFSFSFMHGVHVQLTLEQHRFELPWSTYRWSFSNYHTVSLLYRRMWNPTIQRATCEACEHLQEVGPGTLNQSLVGTEGCLVTWSFSIRGVLPKRLTLFICLRQSGFSYIALYLVGIGIPILQVNNEAQEIW